MNSAPSSQHITTQLKANARQLGFVLTGVCPAVTPTGINHFRDWLERGFSGEMHYLGRRAKAYEHPRHVLNGVRSLLMLAIPYDTGASASPGPGQGRVSRYAWGPRDYHDVVHDRLKALADTARDLVPGVQVRGVIDTAPLLERDFAQQAGLGWIGKNTMLINRTAGSWLFLAALLLDCELDYDPAHESTHCGTCTACLEACPTGAFPGPHVLDATRCISYLTIELRGTIPAALRPMMGDWLFGCDVCQDVCPWNRKSPAKSDSSFAAVADSNPMDLIALFNMDDGQFRKRFRHTPLWRSGRRGVLRNAAIALGNQGGASVLPALRQGIQDPEPLVRGALRLGTGPVGT